MDQNFHKTLIGDAMTLGSSLTTPQLAGLTIDSTDVERISGFWADLLGARQHRRRVGDAQEIAVVAPNDPSGWALGFRPADTPKHGQSKIHLDLTSADQAQMDATVARALASGGVHADVGQGRQEPHVVLADPDGNEFCVLPPSNGFLAGIGPVGAINCDGSQALGYFWSTVLDWPLVWDQDQETAIQAPAGGVKVTWSGPPLLPRLGRDRVRLDLVTQRSDLVATAGRLLELGATGTAQADASGTITLIDPDGNEFRLRH